MQLEFVCKGSPQEELHRNAAYSWGRFPTVEQCSLHERPLAVVGGGASVKAKLERLKTWTGDIWGINQMASWLIQQDIPATLITTDANEIISQWVDGVEKAYLAVSCHPSLFDKLKNKDVKVFNVVSSLPDEITGGPATACRVDLLALKLGYPSVTFFGCEGSFEDSTHASRNENRPMQMLVKADGKLFRTTPDYYATTKYLSQIIPVFPEFLHEESGGLLRGMIRDPEWSVIGYTKELCDIIDPMASEIIYSI